MPIRRKRRPNCTLDMTPMIDCVFQLLIFFMLSSSMLAPQIRIALPEAVTRDELDATEIVLTATAAGELHLNRDPVRIEELADRLRALVEKSKTKAVTFRGDKQLDYDVFLKALDVSRRSGALHLNAAHR